MQKFYAISGFRDAKRHLLSHTHSSRQATSSASTHRHQRKLILQPYRAYRACRSRFAVVRPSGGPSGGQQHTPETITGGIVIQKPPLIRIRINPVRIAMGAFIAYEKSLHMRLN